jgi:hypothetical protein
MHIEISVGPQAFVPSHSDKFQIVRLPESDYCPLESFVRRTGILKSALRTGFDTYMVDENPPNIGPEWSRMLERIALGLDVVVHDGSWYGVNRLPARRNAGPGIGNWDADVLVVGGGQSSKAPSTAPDWPFISSNEYGCAYWLASELERAGIPERALYWVNARGRSLDGHGEPTSAQALKDHGWSCVATLGLEAAEWADKADLPHICAEHHPAFWWRYRASVAYPLIDTLKKHTR